jgi:hypothetical protein
MANQIFESIQAAEKWCGENGYSVGRKQADAPRGVKKGNWDIQKWRNLSDENIAFLDGQINSKWGEEKVELVLK